MVVPPPPPPLKSTWDFFELGIFLKRNDPLKFLRNKLNMKNIGTKSINMSDIMVYLAMFSTIIDQILCFLVPIRWKWVIIFQSLIPSGTWDFFDFRRPPPPNLDFSQLKLGTFLIFLLMPNSQVSLLFRLESFPYSLQHAYSSN